MSEFIVDAVDDGARIDAALAKLAGISRSQAQRWIDADRVRVNGSPCRASRRVAAGDAIHAVRPDPMVSELAPESIPLDIVYEDSDLIVINKPAGMVVHPAPGHSSGTLVNALLHHCDDLAGVGGVARPGIVHRLDRGTSGLLVAAKTDDAHRHLAGQFHDHTIERVYRAVVRGIPRADSGRVDLAIGRHPKDRKRMSVRGVAMREAHTAWRIDRRFPRSRHALLDVMPATGRTHQIRVHLASVGLPIVGDPVYGKSRGRAQSIDRPALHAAVLGFTHPASNQTMRFESPLPADFVGLLESFERREATAR
ncbi:MAG: RluA family pseudouridine synthase [Myxococcota bacterium]